jgi:hypothetical protein
MFDTGNSMVASKFEEIVEELNRNPVKENWEKFQKLLPKSKAKYYKTVYIDGKLRGVQDLTKSYVELYDSAQRPIAKIPIFIKEKKKIEGATYYLKGLLNINKF